MQQKNNQDHWKVVVVPVGTPEDCAAAKKNAMRILADAFIRDQRRRSGGTRTNEDRRLPEGVK